MTAPKPKQHPPVKRVFLSEKVPSRTSSTRLLSERSTLELRDIEGDFTVADLGLSYGFGGRTFLVPWTSVRYIELQEAPPAKRRGRPPKKAAQAELAS